MTKPARKASFFQSVFEGLTLSFLKMSNLSFFLLLFLFGNSNASAQCVSTGDATDGYLTGTRQVIFNTINNSTPSEDNDYSDFTATSSSVAQSSSYGLTVNVNTDGNYTVHTIVWVDWNQDSDFTDIGESYDLGTATNTSSGSTSLSPLSITIPASASLGSTTMRVSTKWAADPTSCETGFDGEVEDYTLIVVEPLVAEIDIAGNSTSIFDGDTSPSVTDDTYFGSADISAGSVENTFTITNTGSGSLDLSGSPIVAISGTHSSDFTVSAQPDVSINANGGSSIFRIIFNPSSSGLRDASVSVISNDSDENPFTFDIQGTGTSVPEIDILGNSTSITDGDATPSIGDDTDFGDADQFGGANTHVFTISNSGSGDLSLTGSPIVQVSGSHAADFSVSSQPASTTVTADGGIQTFQITFNPSATGQRQATVSVTNNDGDESPYTFAVEGTGTINPEIDILGNSVSIADNDVLPTSTDSTSFGITTIGASAHIVTYTINNTGPTTLNLTGSWPLVAISGTHAGDFSVSTAPSSSIASGGSSTFQIAFDPITSGIRSATLTIANDDLNEGSYSFSIEGEGNYASAPLSEINVQGNLISIPDGDSSPSVSDGTDMGSVSVDGGIANQTFTLDNSGSEDLVLTSSPIVSVAGAHSADFTVSQQPSSPVAPSGTVSFTIAFNPSAGGVRSAYLSIENNDADESPYTFTLQGTGTTAPEISVEGKSLEIANGDASPSLNDSTYFGDVTASLGVNHVTYTIRNSGTTTLNLTGTPLVNILGDAAAEYSVTTPPASSVSVGGTTSFTIAFDPSQVGLRNASVSITSDDGDESPYSYAIQGNGTGPGSPLACVPNFFHIYGDNGTITYLDASTSPYTYTTIATAGYHINGMGYNLEDGLLYGFERDSYPSGDNIIRVDGTGTITVLTGVSIPYSSWRADFNDSGEMLFWNSTGDNIATFDASTGIVTNKNTGGIDWLPIDMAFLASDDNFYGIHNDDLYKYDPVANSVSKTTITGRLAEGFTAGTNSAYYGAAWSADDGYVYTTNSQSGHMYKINVATSASVFVGQAEADLNKSDGASCPLAESPLPTTGTVGNKVWIDADADGVQDASEVGLPDVTVSLYGIDITFLASTTTDANGEYSFQNLSPSEYYMTFTSPPSGFTLTNQDQGGNDLLDSDADKNTFQTVPFFVEVGAIEDGIDAGYTATGVGDFVWLDTDQDGVQDAAEVGVPGIDVEIKIDGGASVATTTTDANGYYFFSSGLSAGTNYRLYFTNIPAGYVFSPQNAGGDDAVDSDVNTSTGITSAFSLISGNFNATVDVGLYQQTDPEINISGNSANILDGDITPSASDSTDFGSATIFGSTITVSYTVENISGPNLTLNGTPIIAVSGDHSADFTVSSQPATTIAAGNSTVFTVTFDPSAGGVRNATLSISNTDANENPYNFSIQGTGLAPEVNVKGNNISITDGATTTSASDSTDLGGADIVTGTNYVKYTIFNSGTVALDLSGASPYVSFSGSHAADFSISTPPTTPIAAGDSTSFIVSFDPSAEGARTATLSIANTDIDEDPYAFDIQGTGTSFPEMEIQGAAAFIVDGDMTPSVDDLTDFGSEDITAATATHTFTIRNTGSGALALSGLPIVLITGVNAGDFVVSQQPSASSIAAAGTLTFQVTFDPTTTGVRTATISIENDDTDENPYNFAVEGLGTSTLDQEIEVLGDGVVIVNGDSSPSTSDFTDVGTAQISGIPSTTSFVIRNIGYAVLSLTGPPPFVDISGSHAAEFSISSSPSNSVAVDSATTTFEVTFSPTGLGTRQAILSIQNNDSDEDPFSFTIQGSGIYDPSSLSEIDVTGNTIGIANGDASPISSDGTDFGDVEVIGENTASQSFVIHNLGSEDLVLGANPIISLSGTYASDFSVTTVPASLVAPSSSVTMIITFDPQGTGVRDAIVSIDNNDQDENPYTFTIQGTGTTTPEMSVSGNSVTIVNGDVSPSLTDSTIFGEVDITSGTQLVTYTITNTGNTSLTVGTITISGTNAAEFSVTTTPAATVSTSASTTFVLQFDPTAVGTRNATLSIANSDPDESPYVFDVQGTGTSPEIGVISDKVWLDNDGDGVQDAGESGFAGVTVSLYDSNDNLLGSSTTTSDGAYSFESLASGNYYLTFTNPPAGFALTALNQGGDDALDSDADPNNSGKTSTFFLAISETVSIWDAGFKATGVGNYVWLDVDEDGIQDVGEAGVPGIDVEIKIDGGASVATTTTAANGYYSFTGLSALTYRLYFTNLPAGYVFSPQNQGGDDTIDSDINTSTGQSAALVISTDVFNESVDAGVYQQSAPEISLRGNGISIVDGDTSPSSTDYTDFGSIDAQVDSVIHTFKIYNGNGATLTLNGTPKVAVSGTNSSEFYVKVQPAETIASNDSTTFDIRFIPSSEGLKTASISIANTDADENPYNFDVRGFGLASEIQIEGNGVVISDGDTSATAADHTDFGTEDINTGSQAQIFTILNTGNANLILSDPSPHVTIVGDHAADFSITTAPISPIASNNTTTFTVTFDPTAEGIRKATISLANNDLDENPYTFTIQGIGSASPEIDLQSNGEFITDGDATPAVADNTDFGSNDILADTQVNTFTILNTGSGTLNLSGMPIVEVGGTHAGDFLVSQQPSGSTVSASGGSLTFDVTFDPTSVGLRSATISIVNDDDTENPFNFSIQGTGIASSEINILGNSLSIINGDLTPTVLDSTVFDSTIVDTAFTVNFIIENQGSAVLNLTGASPYVTLTGTHADDYTVTQIPTSTISAGGGTSEFQITFTPSAEGDRTATVNIASDDSDEDPYTFSITGFGSPMPLPLLTLSESVDLATAAPGDTLTYTVIYSNVGDGLATSVIVIEDVPVETSYVPGSAAGNDMSIFYSLDGGSNYGVVESTAVTHIKYERTLTLLTGQNGTVTFKVTVN